MFLNPPPSLEGHVARARELLEKHPEVRELIGTEPWSIFWGVIIVFVQLALSLEFARFSIGANLLGAFVLGAFLSHAIWILIHECAHDLVFFSPRANILFHLFLNFPLITPAAGMFRDYHLSHHIHQGAPTYDSDLPTEAEAGWVGSSPFRKTLWLATVGGWLYFRAPRLSAIHFFSRGWFLNLVVQLIFNLGWLFLFGPRPFLYLLLSTFFSIGLHVCGARWLSEHYIFREGQETYSYYGALNYFLFNIGFHTEHHDIYRIPWSRLPMLREAAPEFYRDRYAHRSWLALLRRFFMDRDFTLWRRIVRN